MRPLRFCSVALERTSTKAMINVAKKTVDSYIRPRHRTGTRRRQFKLGFTLIEVMVSIVIFAWIGLAAYQILDQVILAQEQNQRVSRAMASSQRALWQIGKDFRQIVNRPILDEFGQQTLALDPGDSDYLIQFTRTGWSNPLQWPRSDLQRVAYRIDSHPDSQDSESPYFNDDKLYLVRSYWNVLDRTSESERIDQVLIADVLDFYVRFWDQGNVEWSDSVTTTFGSGSTPGAAAHTKYDVPKAFEVSIVLKNETVLTQIYRVL